jgi:RIO kinase 1
LSDLSDRSDFSRSADLSDLPDSSDFPEFGDLADDDPYPDDRARRRGRSGPRADRPSRRPGVVAEGRSGRAELDTDAADRAAEAGPFGVQAAALGPIYSSYDVAAHGPMPAPSWLVTALSALDTPLGGLKSGKEADVGLLERAVPDGPACLLAVKTYRTAEHRMFHRDAGYQEGRRVRRSRESRAMAKRTAFGRELMAGQWAAAEFDALCTLWTAGARVPYPVQILGSELMMQFIGTDDGVAAPRLAGHDADPASFTDLWHDLVGSLEVLAAHGLAHGDLSPYNVLVDTDGCVLIDLPQVVDIIGNPQGRTFLQRDCRNIAEFFARRGVEAADAELLSTRLWGLANPA